MDAGLTAGQPVGQRAPHRHRSEGCLEHAAPDDRRQRVPATTSRSRCSPSCCRPLPRTSFPNLAKYNGGTPNSRPDIEAIFSDRDPGGSDHPGPDVHQLQRHGRQGRTCSASTRRSHRPRARTTSVFSVWMWPGSPTGAVSWTTWRPLHCARWRGRRWATSYRRSPPTRRPAQVDFGLTTGGTDLSAKGTQHYLSTFPYLGVPYSGFSNPSATPASVAP